MMTPTSGTTKLSIVIPLFNEEGNIEELYCRIKEALIHFNKIYEIIFVDDKSDDKTYEVIRGIQGRDGRVKIIKLTKNYGQLLALCAGLDFAKGEIIITMDGDLQNDPDDIPKFLAKSEEGFDFINGWRFEKNDSLSRRLFSKIANCIIMLETKGTLHDYGCAFTAIKKPLIDKLRNYGGDVRFIKPLLIRLSVSIAEIKVRHHPRSQGVSKYNLIKIIRLGLGLLFDLSLARNRIRHTNDFSYSIEEVIDG